MAEVPEDYDSPSDENEDLKTERPKLQFLQMTEDIEPGSVAEAGPEIPVEIDQEPQPEIEEEAFKEKTPESAKDVPPHLKPTWTSLEEVPHKFRIDLFSEVELGIPLEVKSETFGQIERELLKDLQSPVDRKHEEPEEEAKPDVPEDVPIEESKPEVPEETLREQYEKTGLEPTEPTKPESPSEKPRKSIEEADQQPPKVTTSENPEEIQSKSPTEKRTESPEQAKPEFPEEKPSTATEETQEKTPEPLEETESEFSEEKSRKPIEDTVREPSGKTIPEVQEETPSKSTSERVLEPPQDTKPVDKKDKQKKSTEETDRTPSRKFRSEETLRKSTEEKGPEPPEQTKAEFPKKEPEKTEETGQVPPQKIKPEVQEKTQTEPTREIDLELLDKTKQLLRKETPVEQEKTQTEPTREIDLELLDKTKQLLRKETPVEFAKEDRPEAIKFKHSVNRDEAEYSDYPIGNLLIKETKVSKDYVLEPLPISDIDSVNTDYEFSKELQNLFQLSDTNYEFYSFFSESQRDLKESCGEKQDLCLESMKLVYKDRDTQPEKNSDLQFEYLQWSPEKVATWICQLGFPQYKECFTTNFISGRKLIHVNCSNLPQMGITDFEDMKAISRHTRKLLGIEEPLFTRSIRLPYRDNIGLFLERKGHSGVKSDSLTLSEFAREMGLQDHAPRVATLENDAAL
ncbi:sterile alpha motif domain-containing protein 15 isoform X1 [Bos indicus x Bos taurus]|uniref:sterile alpha motif domain-containing protein 15 isoform X1 n=1 Tax=Bos indicus x Bos taurus TaxID=30522 RepID=UPI000F7D3336|nr:sterile alpha motif domain-containing protein 15 isoform X1 [Bos indicus x Bos taurus]